MTLFDSIPLDANSRLSRLTVSILLLLIVIAGLILRLHLLTRRDLWDDEAASVIFAQLPWSSFLKTMWNYEANMSFYYLLLRGWLHFGHSEGMIRSLSVLFGVALLPATYILGKRLFGEKQGIISAALSAVNLFQIRYSQEARSYSLVMLLSVISMLCFLNAVETPQKKRHWFAYAVVSAIGVYTHFFFYLVIMAQWVWFALVRPVREWKAILWTFAGFVVLTAPVNLFLLTKNHGQLSWVPRPTFAFVLKCATFFTGYGGRALLTVYVALCLLAVFASYFAANYAYPILTEDRRVNLIALWLVLPIGLMIAVSFVTPVFFDRYMAISAPALVLLAGKGLLDLNRLLPRFRILGAVSAVLVVGLSAYGVNRYNQSSISLGDNWRLATRYIEAGQQSGDAAFFYRAAGSRPFVYYSRRETTERAVVSAPTVVFPQLTEAEEFNVEPSKAQTAAVAASYERIWLVLEHCAGVKERLQEKHVIQQALQENYHVSQEKVFPGGDAGPIEVILYTRDTHEASMDVGQGDSRLPFSPVSSDNN